MEGPESVDALRGLNDDLNHVSTLSVFNIERLRAELEAHIEDFRKLVDKPTKNNTSRQAVLAGMYSRSLTRMCPMDIFVSSTMR